jgi:hypothetical protein
MKNCQLQVIIPSGGHKCFHTNFRRCVTQTAPPDSGRNYKRSAKTASIQPQIRTLDQFDTVRECKPLNCGIRNMCNLSYYLQRRSDIAGTSVCYIWPQCEILVLLACSGTEDRGGVAAQLSLFDLPVSRLENDSKSEVHLNLIGEQHGRCDQTSSSSRFASASIVNKMADVIEHYLEFEFRVGLMQQTPWPLVRKRNIPTERQPLVDEI